jgi:signal recognition particle subunit SRP54
MIPGMGTSILNKSN